MLRWLQALVLLLWAKDGLAKAPPTLITVVTPAWNATTGELRRWERDGQRWRQVGAAVPVVIGRSGLGWARDKREGDGRSPAGRFGLGDATGYDEAPPGVKLPYRRATPALRCVDDPQSPAYNTLAEASRAAAVSWSSDEAMRRDDELYRFTLWVRHNAARTPGAGSCIFLHAWRDAATPTVGCTAMALPALRQLLTWADASTELVQLPRGAYVERQRAWDLPPLGATYRAYGPPVLRAGAQRK